MRVGDSHYVAWHGGVGSRSRFNHAANVRTLEAGYATHGV
jgi:hypothetical protein